MNYSFARKFETNVNFPNVVSTAGLACAVAWLCGGGPGFAVASIILDEMDGTIARATGQTSTFGAEYDWAIDIALQGAVAVKIGHPVMLLLSVPASVAARESDTRPPFGSWRAMGMLYALATGQSPK